MLKNLMTGLLALLCFLLQTCVLPGLFPMAVLPNLFIIVTAACGFMNGENTGLLVGFFLGMGYDVFFGGMIGLHAMLYMYLGFLNGKFARVFYPEDIKLPLGLISLSDLTYCLVCYILQFLLRGRLDFWYYLKGVILPELVGTLVATLLVYPLLLKLYESLRQREKRSE